jgi:hypothetical protein
MQQGGRRRVSLWEQNLKLSLQALPHPTFGQTDNYSVAIRVPNVCGRDNGLLLSEFREECLWVIATLFFAKRWPIAHFLHLFIVTPCMCDKKTIVNDHDASIGGHESPRLWRSTERKKS